MRDFLQKKVIIPLLLVGVVGSNRPKHRTRSFKSNYDIATNRKNKVHLGHGEKIDLIKNVLVNEKANQTASFATRLSY